MAVDFNNLVDDNGSGTTGTILDKAELKALIIGGVVQTTTLTGSQSAFVLTEGCRLLICNNASLLTIVGFATGSFSAGQRLTIISKGAGQVNLSHLAGAAEQMFNIATSGATPLAAGSGRAEYEYDGTYLQLIHHEQGAWITPTFAAGNFTGNGAMTWVVASGNVSLWRYRLTGRTLQIVFYLAGTTIGGTPNSQLLIGNAAFGGFTLAGSFYQFNRLALGSDGSAATEFSLESNSTQLVIQKGTGATYTAGTGAFSGQGTFEVT